MLARESKENFDNIKNRIHPDNSVTVTISKKNCSFQYTSFADDAYQDAFDRLNNITVIDAKPDAPLFDTVVTMGVFDLFHDQHKRLIDYVASVGKRVLIYVYHKDEKPKGDRMVPLTDAVSERIFHVAEYASQYKNVIVQRMQRKHLDELRHEIKNKQGSLAVFGGDDQFANFPALLDLCYDNQIPILAINRGEGKDKLCSSDIREKNKYRKIADMYDLDLTHISSSFWKKRISSREKAEHYIHALHSFGLDHADILRYRPNAFFDEQVTEPYFDQNKMIISLPGRTPCDYDRARKIFRTIEEIIPMQSGLSSYLVCYEQNELKTEDYIAALENNPNFFSDDALRVVQFLIIPIMKSQISWEEKLFQLSGIILWTRSRGSVLAIEIENAFRQEMSALGYSDEEIIEAGKQIAVLNICNLASIERERLFTTVSITGINDRKANQYIKHFKECVAESKCENEFLSFHSVSETHYAVYAQIPETILTDKNITIHDKDHHYTPLFYTFRQNASNELPQLIRNIFHSLFDRSVDFNLAEIVQPTSLFYKK